MEADIKNLSRVTAGEISFDQAKIDYFYHDPELNFKDVMAPGFFDKLSDKFTMYSHITVYCLGNNPASTPPLAPSLKRFEIVVVSIIPFDPTLTYSRVVVLPAANTWMSNAPLNDTWTSQFIKWQGFVEWITPPLPNPNPGLNLVHLDTTLIDLDNTDAVLFNQPQPGDEATAAVVRTCRPASNAEIYVEWAPTWLGGTIHPDPGAGQRCRMFIQIWSNIVDE